LDAEIYVYVVNGKNMEMTARRKTTNTQHATESVERKNVHKRKKVNDK
jgi:hypothetical protein